MEDVDTIVLGEDSAIIYFHAPVDEDTGSSVEVNVPLSIQVF